MNCSSGCLYAYYCYTGFLSIFRVIPSAWIRQSCCLNTVDLCERPYKIFVPLVRLQVQLPADSLARLDATCTRFASSISPLSSAKLSLTEHAAQVQALALTGSQWCPKSKDSLCTGESFKRLLRSLQHGIRVLPTGLSQHELEALQGAAQSLNVAFAQEGGEDATHILTKPSPLQQAGGAVSDSETHAADSKAVDTMTCKTRTVKVFQGISSGAWVISQQWLHDSCYHGRPLCEEAYELGIATPAALAGCKLKNEGPPGRLNGPTASRLRNARLKSQPLFAGMRILLVGDFHAPRVGRTELVRFIESCGGTVLDRDGLGWRSVRGQLPPPRRNAESIWIVASYNITPSEINQVAKNWMRRPLTVSWILDCLSAWQLCPPELYRIPDHGCEAEISEDEEGNTELANQEVDESQLSSPADLEHGELASLGKCRCKRCTLRSRRNP